MVEEEKEERGSTLASPGGVIYLRFGLFENAMTVNQGTQETGRNETGCSRRAPKVKMRVSGEGVKIDRQAVNWVGLHVESWDT